MTSPLPAVLLVVTLAGTPTVLPQEPAGQASSNVPAGWRADIRAIDTLLAEGEAKRAYRQTQRLVDRAAETLLGLDAQPPIYGMLLLFRALAAHDLGRLEEATWHWHSAQVVFPALRGFDLTAYGEAGAFLDRTPRVGTEAYHGELDLEHLDDAGERTTRPVKRSARPPTLGGPPEGGGGGGRVSVRTIIDEDGRVRRPELEQLTGPLFLLVATLEVLREWRFDPATRDGEPVAVEFDLTTEFRW